MMRKVNIWTSFDWVTVLLYLILVFMGWLNIYAAVYDEQHSSILDFSQRYGKQLIWIMAALIIAFSVFIIDSNFYSFFAYLIYGVSLFVLVLVLFLGKEVNGARSWFEIGGFGLQPSEFAKVATCLALAKYLSTYNHKIHNIKNLYKLLLIVFVPAGIILLQNDTGSALVYVALMFVLYREGLTPYVLFFGLVSLVLFLSTLLFDRFIILTVMLSLALLAFVLLQPRLKILLAGFLIVVFPLATALIINDIAGLHYSTYMVMLVSVVFSSIVGFIIVQRKRINYVRVIILFLLLSIGFTFTVNYTFNNLLGDHQRNRINELLGISSDPLGAGYNVNQSKIAIGSGGFYGKGFLQGTQTKYNFVPEQSTDFIFCTVGEEWGFMGSFVVLALFTALLLRLVFLAERQRSVFSRVYGYGVASVLFFHVFVNIGMTIGLVPVIGIPLPFFSYGGSSLWAFTILLFIFIRLDASRLELLA